MEIRYAVFGRRLYANEECSGEYYWPVFIYKDKSRAEIHATCARDKAEELLTKLREQNLDRWDLKHVQFNEWVKNNPSEYDPKLYSEEGINNYSYGSDDSCTIMYDVIPMPYNDED